VNGAGRKSHFKKISDLSKQTETKVTSQGDGSLREIFQKRSTCLRFLTRASKGAITQDARHLSILKKKEKIPSLSKQEIHHKNKPRFSEISAQATSMTFFKDDAVRLDELRKKIPGSRRDPQI
jgi:hypothetical protein